MGASSTCNCPEWFLNKCMPNMTLCHHHHTDSRPCRCIFCGDRSRSHTSRYCIATTNTSGSPCHLLRQGTSGPRLAKSGKTFCYAWNGITSYDNSSSCQRGEHWCTLCGASTHNAQNCTTIWSSGHQYSLYRGCKMLGIQCFLIPHFSINFQMCHTVFNMVSTWESAAYLIVPSPLLITNQPFPFPITFCPISAPSSHVGVIQVLSPSHD